MVNRDLIDSQVDFPRILFDSVDNPIQGCYEILLGIVSQESFCVLGPVLLVFTLISGTSCIDVESSF